MAESVGEETAEADRPTVFISYASQDAAVANAVVDALERAELICWMAPRDVVPGALYANEIVEAINAAPVLVLILSEQSVASTHVGKELERASSKRRRIVAVRTDAVALPPAFEYFLSESQWIEVGAGGLGSAASKVVDAVRRHLGSGRASRHDIAQAPWSTPRKRPRRWAILGVAALLAMAILAAAAWKLWPVKPGATATSAAAERPRVSTVAAPLSTPAASVAVMPFANLTGEQDKEYFSDGMAEELINALAKVPGLNVASRTSSFAYKGRNSDIRQVARELGVGTILEGSVRSAGERVRVTAQLVNAESGYSVWSETYDRKFAELFKMQDDLAHEIVTAFKMTMGAKLPDYKSQAAPTQDVEAYSLYLQGQAAVGRNSTDGIRSAVSFYEAAIARDPNFARAYLGLAQARWLNESPLAEVERDARRAMGLDPSLAALTQTRLATVEAKRGNWAAAEELLAPLESDSHAPNYHNDYALSVLWPTGQLNRALRESSEAYRLSPASAGYALTLAVVQGALGQDGEALKLANAAVALGVDPLGRRSKQLYAEIAARAGRYNDAAEGFVAAMSDDVRSAGGAEAARLVYAALADPARKSAAITAVGKMTPAIKPGDWVAKVWAMTWYSQLGVLDPAYALGDELRVQFAGQSTTNAWSWLWGREMRAFRLDPRFQSFATRLGLMKFWIKYGSPDDCDLKGAKLTCR